MTNFYSEFERLIRNRENASRIDPAALTSANDFMQLSATAGKTAIQDPALTAQMESVIQETQNYLNKREEAGKSPIKKPSPLVG